MRDTIRKRYKKILQTSRIRKHLPAPHAFCWWVQSHKCPDDEMSATDSYSQNMNTASLIQLERNQSSYPPRISKINSIFHELTPTTVIRWDLKYLFQYEGDLTCHFFLTGYECKLDWFLTRAWNGDVFHFEHFKRDALTAFNENFLQRWQLNQK